MYTGFEVHSTILPASVVLLALVKHPEAKSTTHASVWYINVRQWLHCAYHLLVIIIRMSPQSGKGYLLHTSNFVISFLAAS